MLRSFYTALILAFFASFSFAQNCQNAIMGGSLSGAQTICSGTIPTPILNTGLPIGGTGAFEYVWIYWEVEPSTAPDDFHILQNSNTQDLQAAALAKTTWFRRCARRSGCVDYVAETNIIKVTVTPSDLKALCKDLSVELNANGQATITASQINNGSTYNCGAILDFQLSQTTFTSAGMFPVTLTATGNNGQTSTCTANIQVQATPCSNVIDGGFISGVIQLCAGENAGTITSIEAANGGSGQLEYRWLSSTIDPIANPTAFTVIAGQTGETLNVGVLNQTTWFRREARRSNCSDYIGLSNVKKIAVTPSVMTAICQDVTIELNANGQASITASQINNGSTLTCGTIQGFLLSQSTFTSAGNFPVTLTATGDNGQSGTCTATVKVQPTPCSNVVNGGFISGVIQLCAGENAGTITSIEAANGGTGSLEYRWLASTTDPIANPTAFTVIAGQTGETLNVGVLNQTTWFRREARRNNCTDYTGLSNVKKIVVNTSAQISIQHTGTCVVKAFTKSQNGSETALAELAANSTETFTINIGSVLRIRTLGGALLKETTIADCTARTILNDSCPTIITPPVLTGCDGAGGELYKLEIKFDNYPGETTWYIKDAAGQVLASGGPYNSQGKCSILKKDLCIPVGCHTLTFKDSYGDGICGAYGQGYYKLKNAAGQTVVTGGNFRYSDNSTFCMGMPVCDNFSNGGQIGKSCQNGILSLTDVQTPSGGTGNMEIVWLKSTQGCSFSTMQEIHRGTDMTITLDAVQVPTYFVRCSRRANCTSMDDFKESNCLVVYPSDCGAAQADCSNKSVLLVVGSTNLCYGDAWVKSRLQQLGMSVQVMNDDAVSSSDANGKALIVVSSSTYSSNVSTKFTDSAVPLITWESYLFGYLKMTGNTAGQDFGSMSSSCLTINTPDHPLADGLSGTFSIYSSNKPVRCGQPTSSAIKVASFCNANNEWAVFAYEKGAAMKNGFAAPGRRVGLFMDDNTPQCLYSKGRRMFDAAVRWAVDCNDLPTLGIAIKNESLTFDVHEINREVSILWTNNTGNVNAYFEVERSQDGQTFETIEKVDGSGPIDEFLYFRIKDEQPLQGESFYRLKWVLTTGDFSYSEIKSVNINAIESFAIFPNPATEFIQIDLSAWAGETASVHLVDMNGKVQANFSVVANYTSNRIDLPTLTPGQFFVRMETAKYRPEVRKIQVVDRF